MQPDSTHETIPKTDICDDAPALYRKEFLKVVLGRAQYIAGKLEYASKTADKNLPVAKDMVHHMSEHFAKADLYVKHLIESPQPVSSDAKTFNKHVLFAFTPAQIQGLKTQLDYIHDALSYGLTATNGAEFRNRTDSTRRLLNESIAEMATLCDVKQTQR